MTPMNAPASDLAAVADRLRAAGCVFADDEARLLLAEASTAADLDEMVARRVTGLPLEQVLGWAEFCGLRIAVRPGVFVPRRRTELLVREAVALAGGDDRGKPRRERRTVVVVDLCCGSGAAGAAVAARLSSVHRPVELHVADVDPVAVACARSNVPAGARVYHGDLYQPLPSSLRGRVDLLLANAPYVPSEQIATMPPEARDHEARVALDGGPDGLDVQRRVVADAGRWLAPGGHLLVETSRAQAASTEAAFRLAGLTARVARWDEIAATVVVGTPAAAQAAPGRA